MRKIAFLALGVLLVASLVFCGVQYSKANTLQLTSCADVVTTTKFGFTYELNDSSVHPGQSLNFKLTVTNQNQLPLSKGRLWADIIHYLPNGQNGELRAELVDQVLLAQGVELANGQSLTKSVSWKVPQASTPGGYALAAYLYDGEGNIVSDTPDYGLNTRNRIDFQVAGEGGPVVTMDRDKLEVNGSLYPTGGSAVTVAGTGPLRVKIPLVNKSNVSQLATVKWAMVAYGQDLPIQTASQANTQQMLLPANQSTTVLFNILPPGDMTYVLRLTAQYQDGKTIVEVPVSKDRVVAYARINSLGIKDGKAYACLQTSGISKDKDTTVSLTVSNGSRSQTYQYVGQQLPDFAVKTRLPFGSASDTITLTAQVKIGNTLQDKQVTTVSCKDSASAGCTNNLTRQLAAVLVLAIVALLGLISGLIYAFKRN